MDFSSGLSCVHTRQNAHRNGRSPGKGAEAGFSLIELMVIVVIVGIFAAIALPSFSSLLNRMSVRSAADEFYGLLQYARAEAVTRATKINVSAASGTTNIIIKMGATTLRQVGANGLQSGVSISPALTSIDFSATGTASTGACFQLSYPTDTSVAGLYVALLTSGRITVPSTTKPSGC